MARIAKPRSGKPTVTASVAQAVNESAPAAWLQWPAHATLSLQRFFDQVQRTEERTLHEMSHDADLALGEARGATDSREVLGLDAEFAAEQWARGAQAYAQVLAAWLDAQAMWWKNMETCTAQLLHPWMAGQALGPSAQALLEAPGDVSTAGLLHAARETWAAMSQAWMNALGHDLQSSQNAGACAA
jgi:hypothetical protein